MEETKIAIPFDINTIKENTFKKIIHKINKLVNKMIRRTIDILVSAIICIMLIPISIFIKLIYLKDGDLKTIFYTNDYIGKKGKIFKGIHYRTINKDGTQNRLRRTAWYNLPEFINVFLGNMTLVGPQPYSVKDKKKMGTYYDRIIQMKPGITGVTQISRLEGKTFENRLDNDIKYFYRKNICLDLKIILITVLITLPKRNEGELLGFLNLTIKDFGRIIAKFINNSIKRIIDIIGALVGIIILIPLTIVIAFVNLIFGDKGQIFYTQERIGLNGKKFKMFKFRTMVIGADEKLKILLETDEEAKKEYTKYKKLKNDPRVTKIGGFLRKTSLDEFPQFLNVLIGNMSLVGPRPYLEREKDEMLDRYDTIIKHKPGITGLWQIKGRSEVTFKDRLDMDIEYHKNTNVIYDIKILARTLKGILKREGAI